MNFFLAEKRLCQSCVSYKSFCHHFSSQAWPTTCFVIYSVGQTNCGKKGGKTKKKKHTGQPLSDFSSFFQRKLKYFQFTPRPLSCKLLAHWSQIIRTGQVHFYSSEEGTKSRLCDLATIRCPIAIFYSSNDSLVNGDKLIEELKKIAHIRLHHVENIESYEHMDLIWANSAPQLVFEKVIRAIQTLN